MNHSQMFLQAQWVTPAREMTAPYFQAQFDCASALSGRLRISGLGFFSATLNGRPVSEDMFVPVWSDMKNGNFFLTARRLTRNLATGFTASPTM